MIPLLHIITFITAVFCFVAASKLRYSYKKTKNKNIGDFFKTFLSLGIYFIFMSLPLFFRGGTGPQIAYTLGYIPVILSAFFLFKVALRILEKTNLIKGASFLVGLFTTAVIFLNFIFFSKARIITSGPGGVFYQWREGTPFWLQVFNGVLVGVFVAVSMVLFFAGGRKSEKAVVKRRSFLIGSGIFILLVADIIAYVVVSITYLDATLQSIMALVASVLALIGLIFMLRGITYRFNNNNSGASENDRSGNSDY
jgi:hypothetical protein